MCLTHYGLKPIAGFLFFSFDEIPRLFQYYFHFSLTFIKYFMAFISLLILWLFLMASTYYRVIALQVYIH